MARVFKRPGLKFFYGRYKVNGEDKWFSTKTTDRKEAQEIADAKQQAARGDGNIDDYFTGLIALLARLPKDNSDPKRQEFARRLMQGQSSTLPLADAWQAWLDSPLKGNPGKSTTRGYDAIWRRFSEWIAKQKPPAEYLHEITEIQAQDYLADLWKSKVAPRTFNCHAMFLKSLFHVLRIKAGLVENVWDDIDSMEKDTQGRQNFTPEELKTICSKATGPLRYMIGIGLYTGIRLGDVVNLKWVNIGKDNIVLTPSKTRRKGKQIPLPIHPVLRALLNELRKQTGVGEYLFLEHHTEYQKDPSATSKQFQKFLEDCGVLTTEPGGDHRRKVIVRKGFHSLRHSFVSLCAGNNVPQHVIQELVGHGSPTMTALYSHADFTQKQDAINGLPSMVFEEQKPESKEVKP
ncbi:MAG: tyrosine-type recombinase/integrase [Kiritimatiellaeota bacterium]|nr:tyrosine-type recombinase/integrase [Kiritimatiellota bacterium]